MTRTDRPSLRLLIWRGLCKRCPRCGQGPLFEKWFSLHDRCGQCDLEYEPRPGDIWAFWVAGDRVFLGLTIVLVYFGVRPSDLSGRLVFLGLVVAAIVLTMPQRQGVCTALDYFFRVKQGKET